MSFENIFELRRSHQTGTHIVLVPWLHLVALFTIGGKRCFSLLDSYTQFPIRNTTANLLVFVCMESLTCFCIVTSGGNSPVQDGVVASMFERIYKVV